MIYDYLFHRNCIKFNYSSNVKVERKKKDFYLAYTLEQETQIYRRKGSSSETFNLLSGHDAIWLFPSCCKISLSWFMIYESTVKNLQLIQSGTFAEALKVASMRPLLKKQVSGCFYLNQLQNNLKSCFYGLFSFLIN